MPEGSPLAWLVAVLGLYVAVAPFVFGLSGTYQPSLIAAGLIVAVLAAWRGWQPDEKVPLPLLPLAVVILGLYTIVAPFVFGGGVGDIAGITLVVSGVVFIVVPAMMVNKMINEKQKGQAA